jgi:hypothetical protein
MIALARQHREGVFEGGEGQLPVLRSVAVGPLRASKAELRASGGTVGVSVRRSIRQAFVICLRPKEICKLLEGLVQSRKPAVSILVFDRDRCRQNVVAGHRSPGSAHGRLLTFGPLSIPR